MGLLEVRWILIRSRRRSYSIDFLRLLVARICFTMSCLRVFRRVGISSYGVKSSVVIVAFTMTIRSVILQILLIVDPMKEISYGKTNSFFPIRVL
jgi:hypothetical protein